MKRGYSGRNVSVTVPTGAVAVLGDDQVRLAGSRAALGVLRL